MNPNPMVQKKRLHVARMRVEFRVDSRALEFRPPLNVEVTQNHKRFSHFQHHDNDIEASHKMYLSRLGDGLT